MGSYRYGINPATGVEETWFDASLPEAREIQAAIEWSGEASLGLDEINSIIPAMRGGPADSYSVRDRFTVVAPGRPSTPLVNPPRVEAEPQPWEQLPRPSPKAIPKFDSSTSFYDSTDDTDPSIVKNPNARREFGKLPFVAGGSAVILISAALLAARFGGAAAVAIMALLRPLAGAGGRIAAASWSRIPGWARVILTTLGVSQGADFLVDFGDDDTGLVPFPGTRDQQVPGSGGPISVNGNMGSVVHQWTANGVPFVRLSNGYIGAFSAKRGWKFWKPKKPIVLFGNGATNLRDFIRADAALNRQSKRLSKALNRRSPRKSRAGTRTVVVETGPGNANVR